MSLQTNYMSTESLDDIDTLLLTALAENSRAAASSLAQTVGLTRQAIADRMDRLRSDGIIQRFTVSVAPDRLGLSIRAFVAITLLPACSEKAEREVIELLRRNPWVQECYRVTGEDYFQVRVVAPEIGVLKELALELRATGVVQGTRTMLALETLFEKTPYDMVRALGHVANADASKLAESDEDL